VARARKARGGRQFYVCMRSCSPLLFVLFFAGSGVEFVDEDRVFLNTHMVQVLDSERELELFVLQLLAHRTPVTAVQQFLVFELGTIDILMEDLGHLLRGVFVQGVGFGSTMKHGDHGSRGWPAVVVVEIKRWSVQQKKNRKKPLKASYLLDNGR